MSLSVHLLSAYHFATPWGVCVGNRRLVPGWACPHADRAVHFQPLMLWGAEGWEIAIRCSFHLDPRWGSGFVVRPRALQRKSGPLNSGWWRALFKALLLGACWPGFCSGVLWFLILFIRVFRSHWGFFPIPKGWAFSSRWFHSRWLHVAKLLLAELGLQRFTMTDLVPNRPRGTYSALVHLFLIIMFYSILSINLVYFI